MSDSNGPGAGEALLKKAVDDREAHPWRYYKLERDVLEKFCEQLAEQKAALIAEVEHLQQRVDVLDRAGAYQAVELRKAAAELARLQGAAPPPRRVSPEGTPQEQGDPCHSSNAVAVGDCGGTRSHVARSAQESLAREWLARQIVKDGREPMLDEGDCRLCGGHSGHEPTDPCGIIAGLLDALAAPPPPAWQPPEALEFAARILDERASRVPMGHGDVTRGCSTYNWLKFASRCLREAAAALPSAPSSTAPQEHGK